MGCPLKNTQLYEITATDSSRLSRMSDNIVPDEKNWTWVLERQCIDCEFDASSFNSRLSAAAIRDLVDRWAAVLAGTKVQARTRPDMWSSLEYGCHIRDVFRKFDERLKLMLETEDPAFENWDQDKTAIEDRYNLQNPKVVVSELRDAGMSLAARFDTVKEEQWSRRGIRSDGSVFTVDSIARYLMHDPVHHLWDVGAEVPNF